MAKSSTAGNQSSMLPQDPPPSAPNAAEIMKPRGWRREQHPGGVTVWRKDDPTGDYFLIEGGGTTDTDPAAPIWTGGRYFDQHGPEGADRLFHVAEKRTTLIETIAAVLALQRLAPEPVFTTLEALRNLVLFHDGDSAFLAANRGTIADMPFGETSFEESLWQVARDLTKKEKQS
jgi:hypothetical protein